MAHLHQYTSKWRYNSTIPLLSRVNPQHDEGLNVMYDYLLFLFLLITADTFISSFCFGLTCMHQFLSSINPMLPCSSANSSSDLETTELGINTVKTIKNYWGKGSEFFYLLYVTAPQFRNLPVVIIINNVNNSLTYEIADSSHWESTPQSLLLCSFQAL